MINRASEEDPTTALWSALEYHLRNAAADSGKPGSIGADGRDSLRDAKWRCRDLISWEIGKLPLHEAGRELVSVAFRREDERGLVEGLDSRMWGWIDPPQDGRPRIYAMTSDGVPADDGVYEHSDAERKILWRCKVLAKILDHLRIGDREEVARALVLFSELKVVKKSAEVQEVPSAVTQALHAVRAFPARYPGVQRVPDELRKRLSAEFDQEALCELSTKDPSLRVPLPCRQAISPWTSRLPWENLLACHDMCRTCRSEALRALEILAGEIPGPFLAPGEHSVRLHDAALSRHREDRKREARRQEWRERHPWMHRPQPTAARRAPPSAPSAAVSPEVEPTDSHVAPDQAAAVAREGKGSSHAARGPLRPAGQDGGMEAEVPPTNRERKLLEFLFELKEGAALLGKELVERIPGLTQSDLTSRLIRELRSRGWEIPNRPRVGYFLSASDRARWERLRTRST